MKEKLFAVIFTILLLFGSLYLAVGQTPLIKPVFVTLGDLKNVTLSSEATGDVFYYDGSSWVNLAKGSNGEILTLAAGIPSWAGGGGALPASTVQYSTLVANVAGGWVEDTGFKVTSGNVTTGGWTATAIAPTYGGTGQNSSGWTGVPSVAAGTWGNNTTLPSSLGGTGLNTSAVTSGQLIIGNTTGNLWALATITGTANQVTVTNGASSITLSLPQDIAMGSNPTFSTLNLSGTSNQIVLQSAGVTGTLTATPTTAGKVWTFQDVTGTIYQTGGTDVAVADGGTGGSSASITLFNNITGYSASGATGTTSTNLVFSTSPTLVTPALGTPASGVATNLTGLPLTTGVTGILPVANGGTNASTASITSFNNITGYTASGATGTTSTNLVFSTSPTLVTPALGIPASGVATNMTGLPLTTGVTGVLPVANGGTNISIYAIGDLIYASTTGILSRLADIAVGSYLASGGVGVAPVWATLNQAAVTGLTTGSSPVFVTTKLSGLTDGYMPYHVADATGLANSSIYTDGTDVGIGAVPTANMDGLSIELGLLTLKERVTPTADAGYGKLYTKTDDILYFQDGNGSEHAIIGADADYAEMYLNVNGNPSTIETANTPIALRQFTTGALQNFTFDAGSTAGITAYANYAGTVAGTVLATSTHGLATGDIISIRGTTNYNGIFQITDVGGTHFYFTHSWDGDDGASDFDEPSHLIAGTTAAGEYMVSWDMSSAEVGGGGTFTFVVYSNVTAHASSRVQRKFANIDIGAYGGCGVITVAANAWIFLTASSDGTNAITNSYGAMTLTRL